MCVKVISNGVISPPERRETRGSRRPWPVRRATKTESARVDPFYATRVLVFAKASALTGALLLGAALGALVFLVTRPIIGVGSVAIVGASVLGAIVLLVGGLIGRSARR